jgi:DNA-binding PadR family transcriptional regulator
MLQRLSEEGLVKKREVDGKYEITPQGREELEWPLRAHAGTPRSVEGMVEELTSYTSYLEDLARAHDKRVAENIEHIRELGNRLTKLGSGS